MTSRQRFTPQHSPSHPSSNASPTSSVSADDERAEKHQQQQTSDHDQSSEARSVKESEYPNALRGWTAHQSHGQATVLFYVPRWIQEESLEVIIGNDNIFAGLRGQKPIVNARLAGRINPTTSAWQLERKSNGKRSRSRSRTRMRTRSSDQNSSSASSGKGWVKAGGQSVQQGERPLASTSSRPISPVQSDTSSFELLARSTDTLASRGTASPHSLSQSMTLSDDCNVRNPNTGSMESSINIENSQATSSSSKTNNFEDPTRDAKLVTLHLDKIDGGIWPCIVSGPNPTRETISEPSFQPLARLITVQSQGSLNAAISEAIRQQQQSHSRRDSFDSSDGNEVEDSEAMVNQSTTTVDTISSDDSTTVLGSGQTAQYEEELYNMDPITLTLMAMQHARRSSTVPFGGASTRDESQAFECYRRAWREAEIPTAIEHLVHYYLPLNPAKKSTILASYRQRLTAALGGSTALARLYVSYAHLYMQSYEFDRPLLALPLTGMSNNPFGTHSVMHEGIQADSEGIGPVHYLLEARRLDPALFISEDDWQEARKLEEERNTHHNWSGAASPSARSDDTSSQPSVGKSRKTKRRKGGSQRDKLGGHHHSPDQGIVFLVVSRAALLSVAVAGCMAVAGWYRRAATGASG
jgi:hypothetical protein